MQNTDIIWRVVPQYSRYEVSNTGLVRARFACDRHTGNFLLKPRPKTRHAYPMYRVIKDNGHRSSVYLHTLIVRAFHGDKPFPNAVTRHLDGNPLNNDPKNLCWGTQKQNVHDSIKHGTFAPTSKSKNSISIGRELKEYWICLLRIGFTKKDIANMYGLHQSSIGKWTNRIYV